MAITAGELIHQAMILAHVDDAEDENPSWQALLGLQFLNSILGRWGSLGIYIPYYTNLSISILPNTPNYTVTPVITEILEANLVDSQNVKTVVQVAYDKLYNTFNFALTPGRPTYVYLSKTQVYPDPDTAVLGSTIYVYANPDSSYTLNLTVKNVLSKVTLFEELLMFPDYYIDPLVFELAKRLIVQFGTQVDGFPQAYEDIMSDFKAANPIDLSAQTENPLQQGLRFRPWGVYVG